MDNEVRSCFPQSIKYQKLVLTAQGEILNESKTENVKFHVIQNREMDQIFAFGKAF